MITILQKDYRTDIFLDEILPISSRADLYKAVKLMGIGGCSQLEKARLCEVVNHVLGIVGNVENILEKLSAEELGFVRRLVDAGTDGHIEVPVKKDGTFYDIQNMFMVVTYEDKATGTWHLIMPDKVRETCSQCLGKHTDETREIYVPDNINKAMDSHRAGMMAKLKADGCPEEIMQHIGGMSNEELLRLMGYSYQKPALDKDSADAELEFLPAISSFQGLPFPKGEDYAFRVLTDAVVHLCQQIKEGSYMNLYFIRSAPDAVKLAACWGDVINSVYGRDVLKLKVMDFLPESTKSKFPYLYKILNERTTKDLKGAYLNTIGFNGQPKQWFVMDNVDDKDGKIWTQVLFYGPYQESLRKETKDVLSMAAKIHDDIMLSNDSKVIGHLVRYMKEGQKSCGAITPDVSSEKPSVERYRSTLIKYIKKLGLGEDTFAFYSDYSTEKLMEAFNITLPTPVFDESKENVEILPVVTLRSAIQMKDSSSLADRIVSESLAHMVSWRGKYYYNLYFLKDGKKVRVLHCLGDTINAVFGYDALKRNGNSGVPKSVKKQFPFLFTLLTGKGPLGAGEPYIEALSVLGLPRQWYLVIDVADKDDYWNTIRLFGPIREDKVLDYSHKLVRTITRMTDEIHTSKNIAVMKRWIDYIAPLEE